MPIKILSKTQTDQYGRTAPAFSGNGWDVTQVRYNIELNLRLQVTASSSVYLDSTAKTATLTSGNWIALIGAFVGANIKFKLATGPVITTTVTAVSGAVLTLASVGGTNTNGYTDGYFQITDTPKDFDMYYNLVSNTVGTGINSLIDGNVIRLRGQNIDTLTTGGTTTLALTQLGLKSGGSIFSNASITITNDAPNTNKTYRVDLTYKIWTVINSGVFFANGAVGDYAEFNMYMVLGDPSTAVFGSKFQLGNTGFEDENFNAGRPEYILSSIAWQDASLNDMDAFDFTQDSYFRIVLTGNFKVADKFDVKIFTIPNSASEYQNKANPLENNLMLAMNGTLISPATPTNIVGNLNDVGAGFNLFNVESTIVVGASMTITGRVSPNAAFTTLFNSRSITDRKYKILVQVEDGTILLYGRSNRVNVLAEYKDAFKNVVPLGSLGSIIDFDIEDHNTDVYTPPANLYLEDDVLVNLSYTLPKNNNPNPINYWKAIKGRVVIEKALTGERYTLEEFQYDISLLPYLSDGTLPLSYSLNRGFNLPATSDKLQFTIERDASLDSADVFGVSFKYPFIVRYEDWLTLQNVPLDFYNFPENDWFKFASETGWAIKFEHAVAYDNGLISGEYIDEEEFTVNDYDDWDEINGSSFEYQRLDGTVIAKPSAVNITKIIATHQLTSASWNGNEWVEIHVRPKKSAPQSTASTVLDYSDINNPLFPIYGETKSTLSVVGDTVTSTVLFDPSKISGGAGVTFTTRIKGSSTTGEKNNIFIEDVKLQKRPFIIGLGDILDPDIEDQTEECRGISQCCPIELKLADIDTESRKRNDVTGVFLIGDTYQAVLKKDGLPVSYVAPSATVLPEDQDALGLQIEWRDVAISDGFGMYTIEIQSYFVNSVLQSPFVWGEYELKPYVSDGYYNAEGTSRILSRFDDVSDKLGINFTKSNIYDSLRISGKFGFNEPNTEVKNHVYLDGRVEKGVREDFDSWELRVDLVSQYFIDRLRFHILGENDCWLSDNNATSPSYGLLDYPVIVSAGYVPEYFEGSRLQHGVVKFEDKVRRARNHFQNNSITASSFQPPNVAPAAVLALGAPLLKSGQTTSYRTGDDGSIQAGRDVDFFTLNYTNPFGNTNRFTDELGGQTYVNDIVIDWSTFDGSTVLGIHRILSVGNVSWTTAIDASLALSVGGFTSGWRLWNSVEMLHFMYMAATVNVYNYAPLNFPIAAFWTSTTDPFNTSNAVINNYSGLISIASVNRAGGAARRATVRRFTVTGTVLT